VARQREEHIQAIDRYATSLFYGAGAERPLNGRNNNFAAPPTNGQARPVVPVLPRNQPVPKVEPITSGSNATNVRNENWRQDQILLSNESGNQRNGHSGSSAPAITPGSGRGNARGPAYSGEFRRTLDALLLGSRKAVV
jgi:hypothetical protein